MSTPLFRPQLRPRFWRPLYCFYYVAYFKSYSKAAKALNITRPSLTRAVQTLEQRLNTTLLVRNTRHVALTEEGRHILGYARHLFASLQKIECLSEGEVLRNTECISLFVAEPLLVDYLIDPLLSFQIRYPNLKLGIYPAQGLAQDLSATHLITIRLGLEQDDSLVQKPLLRFEGGLYASSGYLRQREALLHVENLSDHRLLLLNPAVPGVFEDMNWHRVIQAQDPLYQNPGCIIHTPEHLIKMAEADFGIIAWIKDHPSLKNRALREIFEDVSARHAPQRRAYFVCTTPSFESEGVQALYHYLSQYTRSFSEGTGIVA